LFDRLRNLAARRWLAAVGLLVCAGYGAGFVGMLARPGPAQSAQLLARFLAAHHFRDGIGDYWSSSLVTVDTGGAVTVRPVNTTSGERLVRFSRQSSADWYAKTDIDFFVYDTGRPWHGVNASSVTATYGPPSRMLAVGTYRVLVWTRPFEVAPGPTVASSPLNLQWGLPRR
jgi:hypothetical protein